MPPYGYPLAVTRLLPAEPCAITTTCGRSSLRSGAGALGEQVVLLPGEAYEFQPSCLLPTPAGVVEGRFEVWTLCAGSAGLLAAGWGEPFEVAIPRVGLKFEVNEDGSVA